MPRGGHKGGLFPVSGLKWGMNERIKKRGLYHNRREDILTPRWGYRYENKNKSFLPDGSSKNFDVDCFKAWPIEKVKWNQYVYHRNEGRYLLPSICAYDGKIKNYLMNILDPSINGHFSGIGLDNVVLNRNKQRRSPNRKLYQNNYLYKLMNEYNETILPHVSINLDTNLQRGRIPKLYQIIREHNIWKIEQRVKQLENENIFPYVDENSTLIRELPLSEILYTKSNLRLKVRRHPKWMNVQFLKKKIKIPYLYRRKVARLELQKKELGAFF